LTGAQFTSAQSARTHLFGRVEEAVRSYSPLQFSAAVDGHLAKI